MKVTRSSSRNPRPEARNPREGGVTRTARDRAAPRLGETSCTKSGHVLGRPASLLPALSRLCPRCWCSEEDGLLLLRHSVAVLAPDDCGAGTGFATAAVLFAPQQVWAEVAEEAESEPVEIVRKEINKDFAVINVDFPEPELSRPIR